MFVFPRSLSCGCFPQILDLLTITGANKMYYGSGFQHSSNDDQTQRVRYPPWESDTNRYSDRPSVRPLTGQQIPANFHEYHFRSMFAGSSGTTGTTKALSSSTDSRMSPRPAELGISGDGETATRNWELTGLGSMLNTRKNDPTLMGGGIRFTILSYNILAQSLLEKHSELYKKCSPENLEWNFRLALLFQEIDKYSPDIICLQEVEESQYQQTLELRFQALGFRGVYKKKTGDKVDGCAIFFRTAKFLLIERLDVELLQPHVPLLNRDNIGLFVKLETRNVIRRQKVIVGTTHLLFNHKRQDVKLAQIQILLAEMDRFAFCGFDRDGNTQYHPILMTGDFNCKPYSPVTRLFSEGRFQYLDENGDIIKLLRRKGMNSLIPRHSGVSDQCQHYKIILERYRKWKSLRNNNFYLDLKSQEALVNLFPYLEARGYYGSATGSETCIMPSHNEIVSLLSPIGDDISGPPTPSVVDLDGVESKLLFQAAEKVAMHVNNSRANIVDTSRTPSKEQLYFPERHTQLEGHLLNEINSCGLACDFASGVLTHGFNFRDIHSARLDRKAKDSDGVTSKQNGWTCVDYIYQSMTWHPTFNKLVEGKLKLVRRLGLLTRAECKNKHIPDEQHPSDHFPLVAEFLLRP